MDGHAVRVCLDKIEFGNRVGPVSPFVSTHTVSSIAADPELYGLFDHETIG